MVTTRSAPGVYRERRFHLQSTEDLLTFPFPFPFSLKSHITHYRQHPSCKPVDGKRTTGYSRYGQWIFGFTLSMQRQIDPHSSRAPAGHSYALHEVLYFGLQNDRSKKITRKSKYYYQEYIHRLSHIVLTIQTLSMLWLVVEESVSWHGSRA